MASQSVSSSGSRPVLRKAQMVARMIAAVMARSASRIRDCSSLERMRVMRPSSQRVSSSEM